MSKPPAATPNSDIDGVHEDEERNTDVANAVGQDSGDLKRAKDHSIARPRTSEEESRDDRTG
jgi:hypothetical protein